MASLWYFVFFFLFFFLSHKKVLSFILKLVGLFINRVILILTHDINDISLISTRDANDKSLFLDGSLLRLKEKKILIFLLFRK